MTKVLMLGQQTSMAYSFVADASEIRTSAPRFNLRGFPEWESPKVEDYNAPVFGVSISEAVFKLLQNPGLSALATKLGVRLPHYQFDVFCQSKASKIQPLIDECRSRGLDVSKLETFVGAVKSLDASSINSMNDWDNFLTSQRIAKDWRNRLHYDHMLGLFFDNEKTDLAQLKEIRNSPAPCKTGENPETLENYSMRWLGKCLNLWVLKGCLTDIVNTICAMLGADDPHQLNETQLTTLVDKFADLLIDVKEVGGTTGTLEWLWLPDIVMMDAEGDDCVAWVLCLYLANLTSRNMKTYVQLPQDGQTIEVDVGGKKVAKTVDFSVVSRNLGKNPDVVVFRDPDSRNISALASYHGL